ncbi:MAG: 30S ribosomal protein S7, partial [Nanoarchaeota archaeon]|nr:30S ribosomal protein S7 [Nanoarchaeota archaeon]
TQGAYQNCFGKKRAIEEALADEIIKAYQMDQGSAAISKKLELERQADASR